MQRITSVLFKHSIFYILIGIIMCAFNILFCANPLPHTEHSIFLHLHMCVFIILLLENPGPQTEHSIFTASSNEFTSGFRMLFCENPFPKTEHSIFTAPSNELSVCLQRTLLRESPSIHGTFERFISVYVLHRTLVKSAKRKFNFLISQQKHMLWVLKRTISMRGFF